MSAIRAKRVVARLPCEDGAWQDVPALAYGPLLVHRNVVSPGQPPEQWCVSHESGHWIFLRNVALHECVTFVILLLAQDIDWSEITADHLDQETAGRILELSSAWGWQCFTRDIKTGLPASWLTNGGHDIQISEKWRRRHSYRPRRKE